MVLKRLNNQTIPRDEYEIIVVDGKSNDGTLDIAKKLADKVIQQESKGIGGARNDGAKVAKGEILVSTDADTLPPKNWLERILYDFENYDIVGVSGPLVPYDGDTFGRFLFRFAYDLQPRLFKPFFVFMFGPNTAIKRDAFFKCGGYAHLEVADDAEIYLRLKNFGKVLFDRDLIMFVSYRRFREEGPIKLTLYYNWINFNYFILRNYFEVNGYAKKKYKY